MSGVLSDTCAAEALAQGFHDIDLSGATAVPSPARTTVPATLRGVGLGDGLLTTFQALDQALAQRAEGLCEIAAVFRETDIGLGLEVPS